MTQPKFINLILMNTFKDYVTIRLRLILIDVVILLMIQSVDYMFQAK